MAARRTRTARLAPTRRTQIVWVTFVAAMTLVIGILAVTGPNARAGFIAASTSVVGDLDPGRDPIFEIDAPLDGERWQGIVIHHLGEPAGDADSIHRLHQSYGWQGLGHHFLIGNGNGMGDGVIHMGYRWLEQLPAPHVWGPAGDWHNHRSISICLVGNGDRRPFTPKQISQTISLVRRLRRELDLPADAVYLHRDLAPQLTTSPGRLFPAADLQRALAR